MKTEALAAIGEAGLLRAAQVGAALAANGRIKYLLSLLQMAVAQADRPDQPASDLKSERLACGVDCVELDQVVGAARRQGDRFHVPYAGRILAQIVRDMRELAVPVLADGANQDLSRRLETMLAALPAAGDDLLNNGEVAAMTRASRDGADGLHPLVMDLHKALNAIQAELAEEQVDGARVYGLQAEDRPLIAAFMAGVNRTAGLKFNHPGLGTTATRADGQRLIQNDIGATDAHVIVVRVRGLAVETTYTDVHAPRARFLRDMLARFAVSWSGEHSGAPASLPSGTEFTLATGRFEAKDEAELRRYLGFLGSRLVFLIDWNRARKQLRDFLGDEKRVELLRWVAEQEIGHRGFLELGGAKLINQAIEAAAGTAVHFGDRLSDMIGEEATMSFLRFVFRAASEGLTARQSHGLIRDRMRADLAAHFSNESRRLLQAAGDHAGLRPCQPEGRRPAIARRQPRAKRPIARW